MADKIKAALAAACNARLAALLNDEPGTEYDLSHEDDLAPIAAAIAAFLLALPTCSIRFEQHGGYGQKVLAAAVERAAREGGG